MKPFILASGSPRRKELLEQAFLSFTITTSSIAEIIDPNDPPEKIVQTLAREKASDVLQRHPDAVVLGADTVVATAGAILGKPGDKNEAATMLKSLSGRQHDVYTGVSIISKESEQTFFEQTKVTFLELTQEEITAYIDTKEPFDKAGAYGIQGFGATLVKEINGDYFTVVGLPLSRTVRELRNFGVYSRYRM